MSLESELDQQYIKLSDDIRSSIDNQDAQFIEMSKSQYGDGNYEEDREDYLIEQKINDLSQKREAIWNYLNKEYQENTKERKLNFKLLSQREKDIEKQLKEIKNLKQDKERIITQDNIRNRNIGHQKFIAKRHDYYFYLYKIIAVVLIMTSFAQENGKVLEIKTVQIAPFRTLMTALKDILLETNITFSPRWYSHYKYG